MAGAEAKGRLTARAAAGARAEMLAAQFLMTQGLTIVTRNFRVRRGEIDLIARDGETLVFVEVRMRRSQAFGGAGASITRAKCARLAAAANFYLAKLGREPPCRFDAVLLDGLESPNIAWERDILSEG